MITAALREMSRRVAGRVRCSANLRAGQLRCKVFTDAEGERGGRAHIASQPVNTAAVWARFSQSPGCTRASLRYLLSGLTMMEKSVREKNSIDTITWKRT
jgi:hypothetical protein